MRPRVFKVTALVFLALMLGAVALVGLKVYVLLVRYDAEEIALQVQIGMSKEEVLQKVGKPNRVSPMGPNGEAYNYFRPRGRYDSINRTAKGARIDFVDGKVVSISTW